jgi:hypothetical protein
MHTDPLEARRAGAHRLRVVTASIGAAAVVGTGVLTWSLVTDTASASADQSTSDGSTTSSSTSGDSFSQSSTLPQTSTSGSPNASSGGS